MAIFLLSLAGVPPMAGFVGKFYIFSEALHQGYAGLVIIAVLNSVVATYYYFYVLVAMYMQEGGVEVDHAVERGIARARAHGHGGEELVVIDPDVRRHTGAHAFQRNQV